jgi:hypothetical protein
MVEVIPIVVGYDPRESVAYHTFCQSVLSRASKPVAFYPLISRTIGSERRADESNEFITSRFLTPYLMGWQGHAIFADGDMVVTRDIAELWALRDHYKAVQVVKHDYRTRHPIKYLGNKNEDYPRKNWSSVMIWNAGSYPNRCLTPEYVAKASGSHLHRFEWIADPDMVGSLPPTWNHLVGEYDKPPETPALLHYTIGIPSFSEFAQCDYAQEWHKEHYAANQP